MVAPVDELPRGSALGRYLIVEPIGAGGMGVVYAAYDPELDRKVAVKLLRRRNGAQERLLREAQAMARLAHPNVVPVYDVGVRDGEVFVAMELVAGETLAAWRGGRGLGEVVSAYLAAGRGLAAAHAAGIVHRDFKPDNVLVRRADGQVLVGDFGLAQLANDGPAETTALGTLAYMSPEQHRGDSADPRSDQFAFCVALYEALYFERPFAAGADDLDTRDGQALEVLAGRVRPAPARSGVPAWLRRIVVRGLAVDPAERYPSMDALLAELGRDPRRRLRRWLAVGAAAALLAVGAVGVERANVARRAVCVAAAHPLAAVFGDDRRAAVGRAFAATGLARAADTAERVDRALSDYAAGWRAMRVDACEATELRHTQSAELLDLRMLCLDRRLTAFAALVEVLSRRVDGALLDRAVDATSALPPLAACADAEALRADVPPPSDPTVRARVEAIATRLAQAQALEATGRLKDERAVLVPLIAEARATGYAPIIADALFRQVRVAVELEPQDNATRAKVEEALAVAASARQDARVAQLISDLQFLSSKHNQIDTAFALKPLAEAALRRAGDPPAARQQVLNVYAELLTSVARYPEAETELRMAIAIEQAAGLVRESIISHLRLSQVLLHLARYDEVRAELDTAVELIRARLGPRHPRMFVALTQRGTVDWRQHDFAAALADWQEAATLIEETLGPDHDNTATAYSNIGIALHALGRLDDAARQYQRALAIREKSYGPDAPRLAEILDNIADIELARGQPDAALAAIERAIAIRVKALGADNVNVGNLLATKGTVLAKLGRLEEARATLARGAALADGLGAQHPLPAQIRVHLADVLVRLGRFAEARAVADAAIAVLDVRAAGTSDCAAARLVRAQAAWALGDRAKAQAAADEATAIFASLQPTLEPEGRAWAGRLAEWRTAHPPAQRATAAQMR
jgi:tetratricopeptide (TPR) repeat protein